MERPQSAGPSIRVTNLHHVALRDTPLPTLVLGALFITTSTSQFITTSISQGGVMSVTLAQASTIVDVALKKAREMNLVPMTVAVLDAGGHLVAFKREDKSGILRYDIAYGKAWGALGMGFGSRTLFERASNTPKFFNALHAASGGRMVTNPGGVLI